MFFTPDRNAFFKPLTSKYREHIVRCLSHLYQKQYSENADYGALLERHHIIDAFSEILAQTDTAPEQDDAQNEPSFKEPRELANYLFKQLLDYGWLEKKVDAGLLATYFLFSRTGRTFCQALISSTQTNTRTRHRNTRNTLNALEAFHRRQEVHDLLDAYDYSERIISDFTDVIAELEEQKRALVKEVENKQLIHHATDQFFAFMETRFQPDISVRLSADSVEKHRDAINQIIHKIKRLPKETKAKLEQELRHNVPGLTDNNDSFLWYLLNHIDRRMRNAAEIMLPALREAIHGFTRRADMIIRQLSHMSSQKNDDIVDICRELKSIPPEEASQRLQQATTVSAQCQLRFVDPASIKAHERKSRDIIDTSLHNNPEIDPESLRQQQILAQLEQMYLFNQSKLKDFIGPYLSGEKTSISNQDIAIDSPSDLIFRSHIIELAQILDNGQNRYEVSYKNTSGQPTHYFEKSDTFTIKNRQS